MKRIINISLFACIIAVTSSCVFVRINPGDLGGLKTENVIGSDNVVTDTISVPQFTGIDTSVSCDIEYSMTEGEPSAVVTAPDNIIGMLDFTVEDGILKVRFDDDRKYTSSKVSIRLSSETLTSLAIRGAGDFKAVSGLDCSGLEVRVLGAGDVELDDVRCSGDVDVEVLGAGDIDIKGLSCNGIEVDILGAGDVGLAGKAGSADLSIKGAGDIDIRKLECTDVRTSVSGVGSVKRK